MAVQETPQSADAREARIRELTEENGLLFEQLHVVQEELEKYHHKLKECEQRKGTVTGTQAGAGTPEPAAILAENQKLQALVEQQRIALGIETQNSLPSRLGNMFIAGAGSAGSILKLLCKLRTLWKALDKTVPPAELGGKTFQKVIDAHTEGGPEAVETLLDSVFIASPMRANAYTALARHLMPLDVKQTADDARLAWETDPRPYRLKWLAFRLHDAGDAITAEALLDMLPADIPMSESEQRQAMQIHHESEYVRTEKARKECEKYRREVEQVLAQKASLQKLADERKNEVAALTAQLDKQREEHKQERERLSTRVEELQKSVDQYRRDADQARIQQENLQKRADEYKKESDALTVQTAHMLKSILTQFEPDKAVLSQMMRIVMGATITNLGK